MDMVATLQNKFEHAYISYLMPMLSDDLQLHVQSFKFRITETAVWVQPVPTSFHSSIDHHLGGEGVAKVLPPFLYQ